MHGEEDTAVAKRMVWRRSRGGKATALLAACLRPLRSVCCCTQGRVVEKKQCSKIALLLEIRLCLSLPLYRCYDAIVMQSL